MTHYLDLISPRPPGKQKLYSEGELEYPKRISRFGYVSNQITNDVLYQVDTAGKWKFLSPDWHQMSGFKVDESLGISFLDFVCLDDGRGILELFQELMCGLRTSFSVPLHLQTKSSGLQCVELYACLLLDDRQNVVGMTGTLSQRSDQTYCTFYRHSQKNSTHYLEDFFQSLSFPAGIIELKNSNIEFIFVNKSAEKSNIFSAGDWNKKLNRGFENPCQYFQAWLNRCHKSRSTGRPQKFDCYYKSGMQSKWFAHTVCSIGRSESGNTILSFTAIDITEDKHTLEALLTSENRYRSVLEALTEYVHCCSPDYKFTFTNQAYCNFRKKSADKLLGIGIFDDVSPEDREHVKKHFDSLTLDNPIAVGENRTVTSDGQVRWHQWIDRAIFNEKEELIEVPISWSRYNWTQEFRRDTKRTQCRT